MRNLLRIAIRKKIEKKEGCRTKKKALNERLWKTEAMNLECNSGMAS